MWRCKKKQTTFSFTWKVKLQHTSVRSQSPKVQPTVLKLCNQQMISESFVIINKLIDQQIHPFSWMSHWALHTDTGTRATNQVHPLSSLTGNARANSPPLSSAHREVHQRGSWEILRVPCCSSAPADDLTCSGALIGRAADKTVGGEEEILPIIPLWRRQWRGPWLRAGRRRMEAEGRVYHNGFNYDPTANGDAQLHELKRVCFCVCVWERGKASRRKRRQSLFKAVTSFQQWRCFQFFPSAGFGPENLCWHFPDQ